MQPSAAGSLSRGLVGGLVAAILTLTTSLSFAALVFSGNLSGGLERGIGATLLASAIMSLVLLVSSSTHFTIGGASGNATAIFAVSALAIAHGPGRNLAPEALGETVMVGIAIATAVTALVQFALGAARLGRWMRFIPYPVIGGVLGAAGWLLSTGALRAVGATPPQKAAGVACALLLLLAISKIKHPLALPGLLGLATAAFYAYAGATHRSIDSLRADGWLFSLPPGSVLSTPWTPAAFAQVSWSALLPHAGDLLTIAVVTTLAVLLSTSGLELAAHVEADLDNDLRAQGIGNALVALAGGFTACQQLSVTLLTHKLSGTSRIPPLVVAVVSFGALFAGSTLVDAIPRFVFGALILTIGLSLLLEWCVRTARRLPFYDYASILAIVVVVANFGYVAGVVAGVLIGCMIFVVSYSRVPVVKHSVSGKEFRSRIVRSAAESAVLDEYGGAIRILLLQGFIFFGMADALYRAVRALIESSGGPVEYIVLEFSSVEGIDSSAVSSFAKLHRLADAHGIILTFTGMSEGMEHKLQGGETEARTIVHYGALDNALEFCESGLLADRGLGATHAASLLDWLTDELGERGYAERLATYLLERTFEHGERICGEGEPAEAMYLIARGRVVLHRSLSDGTAHRVRSLGDRTILGEMGLYRTMRRSATISAELPSIVYVFSRDAFVRMQRDDPELAAAFHAAIVRTLADRLESGNAMIEALRR